MLQSQYSLAQQSPASPLSSPSHKIAQYRGKFVVVVVKISVVVVGGSVVGFCVVGPAVVCGTVVVVDFSVVVDDVVGDGGGEVVVGIVDGEVGGGVVQHKFWQLPYMLWQPSYSPGQ